MGDFSHRSVAPPLPQKGMFASAKRLQARAFNADLLTTTFLRLAASGGTSPQAA
jgi:hypothetical protein